MRHGALLTLAGRTGAAAVLVGAGALIAIALNGGIGAPAPAPSSTPAPVGFTPPPGPPPSSFGPLSGNHPGIELLQPMGDGTTGFVLHGAGWPPLSTVTLTLAGRPGVSVRLVADGAGVFNYTIDQGHVFYPGRIPTGRHRVVVTGDGHRLSASFRVMPPPPGGPPPG
jgi:hypothetical protein